MTTLKLDCAMCSRSEPLELEIKPKDLTPDGIQKLAKQRGWIIQFNGDNIDAYCSKKCAK